MKNWIEALSELWIFIGVMIIAAVVIYLQDVIKNKKFKKFFERIESFLTDIQIP